MKEPHSMLGEHPENTGRGIHHSWQVGGNDAMTRDRSGG